MRTPIQRLIAVAERLANEAAAAGLDVAMVLAERFDIATCGADRVVLADGLALRQTPAGPWRHEIDTCPIRSGDGRL